MSKRRQGKRAVAALLLADLISLTGNRIALLTVPWFVLETSGSAFRASAAAAASIVPLAVGAFVGGHVVDRLGARGSSVIADLASGVSVGMIPLLYWAGELHFGLLLILVFLGSAFDGPGNTARRALLPAAAEQSGYRLGTVVSLSESAYRVTQVAGGAAAAGLIVAVGAPGALLVDVVTFAVSALLVLTGTNGVGSPPSPSLPFRASLAEGVRYIRDDQLLRGVIGLFLVVNVLENGLVAVMLPLHAQLAHDPRALGYPIAALGLGSLIGALIYVRVQENLRPRPALLLGVAAAGVLKFVVLVGDAGLGLLVTTFAVAGVAGGVINPMLMSAQLLRIPASARGRVLGASMCAVLAAVPVGLLAFGGLGQYLPLSTVALVGGGLYLAVGVWVMYAPWVRLFDSTLKEANPEQASMGESDNE